MWFLPRVFIFACFYGKFWLPWLWCSKHKHKFRYSCRQSCIHEKISLIHSDHENWSFLGDGSSRLQMSEIMRVDKLEKAICAIFIGSSELFSFANLEGWLCQTLVLTLLWNWFSKAALVVRGTSLIIGIWLETCAIVGVCDKTCAYTECESCATKIQLS